MKFKTIDLFAGIGGIRFGFERAGEVQNVFSCEIDKYARESYKSIFGEYPDVDDINKVDIESIPDFNILLAGFPCQPFSIAGNRKGFDDNRGNLFFKIIEIAKIKYPEVIFLENVKGITNHDKGNTLKTIFILLQQAGYFPFAKILNSKFFGVPQNRERIFIIATRKDLGFYFDIPETNGQTAKLTDILEENVDEKYYIKNHKWLKYLQREKTKKYSKVNPEIALTLTARQYASWNGNFIQRIGHMNKGSQGQRIYNPEGLSVCLGANGGGQGAKTGLYEVDEKIRRLTPRECGRLQGYPEEILDKLKLPDNHLYKQFGNGVTVTVVETIAKVLIEKLEKVMNEKLITER